MMEAAVSPLIPMVAWSVLLLVFHIGVQSIAATRELGSAWNASPRDNGEKPTGVIAGRAERALANFKETYPAFIGLALALAIVGDPSGWGLTGAWIWLVFRVVYIAVYLAGIAYIRSLLWLGSLLGLLVMFFTVVF